MKIIYKLTYIFDLDTEKLRSFFRSISREDRAGVLKFLYKYYINADDDLYICHIWLKRLVLLEMLKNNTQDEKLHKELYDIKLRLHEIYRSVTGDD